ncbi:hypothetical protein BpHYR1_044508 [Brachionus plicatilis]|uniref:Uncharacterized protein n=1 Tax=Brachionus plicatilis TaxID=10195 RepID=A0A3M7SZ87_BRAPC|nr:hypothetical protein BpHYR1_044508 [Brachionus plicatilis]
MKKEESKVTVYPCAVLHAVKPKIDFKCMHPVPSLPFIVFGLSGLLPPNQQTSAGCNKLVMRGGIKLLTIPFTCFSSFTLLVNPSV